jgi:CP family cyanate transporter-like MFS transporter
VSSRPIARSRGGKATGKQRSRGGKGTGKQRPRQQDGQPSRAGRSIGAGAAIGPATAISIVGVVLVALTMRQAVAGVPPILADLGLSTQMASLLVAVPVVCFSLGALAGPALRARLGEERAIFVMVATLFVGMAARALWPGWALLPGTMLAGLAIAVLNVLLPSLVKRRFPNRVGAMMAAYTVAMATGSSLAAGFTYAILQAAGGSVNVALGVWAVPAALGLVGWLPQIGGGASTGAGASGSMAGRRTVSVWRFPLAWHVTFFMGLQSLLFYGPLSWLPAIFRDRGIDPTYAGILLLLFNGLGIVGNLTFPVIAARQADQRWPVAAAIGLMTFGLLGILLAPTSTAIIWVIVLGVSQGASLSLALLAIVLRSADADTAAALSGMAQSGGYLLASLGPLVMGLLHSATGGWTAPLLFLLAVCVVIWVPALTAARSRTITGV